ncbi:DUF4430 domain-containing protein [Evansella tamaricis]|uniref:DUF4430 domain-containing protein n=1 Tax=Evansella tamaricis TaxID=2069301 RepID=A0ABS6JEA8_9BACI|nr:DUF4430 domain-containing protein [Evansella tamaricis]MBU9712004.1 DUF4430 domain-containing protein [Evansella tamaricis]
MKRTGNIFLSFLLVFGMLLGSIQTAVVAESEGELGKVRVIGGEEPFEATYEYTEEMTALEILEAVVGEENVETSETDDGISLDLIFGVGLGDTHFWDFYINGIQAQVGSGVYVVNEGDNLTFKYTDWTEDVENSTSIKVINYDTTIFDTSWPISFLPEEQPTAFDLLLTVLGYENIDYTYYDVMGYYIERISNNSIKEKHFWAFYVDKVAQVVGASNHYLENGDQIKFNYESWDTGDWDDDGSTGGSDDKDNSNDLSTNLDKAIVKTSVEAAKNYVLSQTVGDWQAIALKQAGYPIPTEYLASVKKAVSDAEGQFRLINDTSRRSLGILAAGADPTNIEGYNLIERIYNGTNVTNQGLVGVAFSLIALDSANFTVPADALWTREALIEELLNGQLSDGGWNWTGRAPSDLDSTAMILTALAPYENDPEVQTAIDSAVQLLVDSFIDDKVNNSSTAAQIIIALSALELDANAYHNSNDTSLIEYLLSFQNETDGGFGWQNTNSDAFSTDQAFRGIVAYQLFIEGKSSLYSFGQSSEPGQEPEPEKEEPATPISDDDGTPPVAETETDNGETEEETTTPVSSEQEKEGHRLPDTSTLYYNLLALGILLVLVGAIYLVRVRRLKAMN